MAIRGHFHSFLYNIIPAQTLSCSSSSRSTSHNVRGQSNPATQRKRRGIEGYKNTPKIYLSKNIFQNCSGSKGKWTTTCICQNCSFRCKVRMNINLTTRFSDLSFFKSYIIHHDCNQVLGLKN